MKRMTNAQIAEINELLKNHGEAMTAFYDEGILQGMRQGGKWILVGVAAGFVLNIAAGVIRHIKKNSEEGG